MSRVSLTIIAILMALSISGTVSSAEVDPPAFAYLLHCSGCHLEDGSGDPPLIPDLRQDLNTLLESAKGRAYMLRVPGVSDAPIAAQQMADLMNWMIRTLYPEQDDFEPFSAEEVVTGRDNRLYDPIKYRQENFP